MHAVITLPHILNAKYNSDVPLILMDSRVKMCKAAFVNHECLIWYPPGHGNIFQSMHLTGILDELISTGRHICFISNIDNTSATADLSIAKFMLDSGTEYAMECTEKTSTDTKIPVERISPADEKIQLKSVIFLVRQCVICWKIVAVRVFDVLF
uniref:UTP--glucose-1-phosphate uridylyltransferase n=1 Tax=Parascaris equorum TaxID=6256 RepID=A0A914RTG8_PAREQ